MSHNLFPSNYKRLKYCILALVIFAVSCSGPDDRDYPGDPGIVEVPVIPVPEFNSDSAYFFIQEQVDFGPRIPNTPAHDSCAEFLIGKLRSYTDEVIVQRGKAKAYNGKELELKNIIASFTAAKKEQTNDVSKRKTKILLCSHWDTRPFADRDKERPREPFDGANDGGSGVGVLLEIARLLSSHKPEIEVDIILFDVEDYGNSRTENSFCLGSQYWAKNPPIPNYYPKYGILLDMVGAKNATF